MITRRHFMHVTAASAAASLFACQGNGKRQPVEAPGMPPALPMADLPADAASYPQSMATISNREL
ncbi:MAG: hypothetical protein VX589_00895, partial [Myxococcota bacterium]|nr:hypothetical protein [Myxococcota bacterium]